MTHSERQVNSGKITRLSLLKHLFPPVLLVAALFLLPASAHASVLTRPANNLGLVGYWQFNEGSGSLAHDVSGNGVAGVVVNGPATWTTGKFGSALLLSSASNQQVQATSTKAVQFSTTQCAWIKLNSYNGGNFAGVAGTGAGGTILTTRSSNATFGASIQIANFHLSANKAVFIYNTAGTAVGAAGNTTIALNTWYFICGTFSYTGGGGNFDGNWQVYVNGVEDDSSANNYLAAGGNPSFPMNGTTWNIAGIDGAIDDVRIYNRALSAADVLKLYQLGTTQVKATLGTAPIVLTPTAGIGSGLVGYWPFNEGTGNTTADISGNKNTGTLVNAPSWVKGKYGNALSFNGTNYISLGNVAALSFPSTDFGICAWAYPIENSNYREIVNKGDSGSASGSQYEVLLDNSGKYAFNVMVGGVVDRLADTATASLNKWAYVCGVRQGALNSLYVNGILRNSASFSGPLNTTSNGVSIGAAGNGNTSLAFRGTIDEVRIYNRALSSSEVKQLYLDESVQIGHSNAVVSNGLVGWWTMDGNNLIQNVKDSSGQGNNGSLVGFSATSSAEVAGKIGGALKFNGTSQYITVPDTTALRLSGNYSVSVWIRPAALKDYGNVLFKESLISNTGYGLITFANGSWGWQIGNTLDIQTSAALLKNTTWSLLIATYDGTNVRLYQNGSLLSTTVASAVASDATALALGADTGDGRYFNGTIDDVRVYNRALSASEIQALYAAGR
ncbi:hypothetical protein KGO04_00170 [Patescibacteria group bacterium]|nr:hypothetical protein [Patescibacteria group bacterium]MDE1944654.1 LamG domain-containing protein [Patescibacteria group bacterium]